MPRGLEGNQACVELFVFAIRAPPALKVQPNRASLRSGLPLLEPQMGQYERSGIEQLSGHREWIRLVTRIKGRKAILVGVDS